MLGALNRHRLDTDAGMEQRWEVYFGTCKCTLSVPPKVFLPKPVEKHKCGICYSRPQVSEEMVLVYICFIVSCLKPEYESILGKGVELVEVNS